MESRRHPAGMLAAFHLPIRLYILNRTDSLKYTARGWYFDSIFRGKLLCYTQVCGAEADHCRGGIVFGFSAAHLQ